MKNRIWGGGTGLALIMGAWFFFSGTPAFFLSEQKLSPEQAGTQQHAKALRPLTFVTDWKAQAEQGGFYQAQALGYYRQAGLDVTLRSGGPGVNIPQLLATGATDLGLGSNSFIVLNSAVAGTGVRAVMASFQKDPQVLITHPRTDISSLEGMRGHPVMVSDATIGAFWLWLQARFGFENTQIRKYTFNLAPFLTNRQAVQQGYLTSEPYMIEKETGTPPQVFLLADYGYPGYGAFVLAPDTLIKQDPESIQAFVDATIRGWVSYLYGDPSPGNTLILAENPEMRADILAQAIQKLRQHGIVDSGDTSELGIGAMTRERWTEFFETMTAQGLYAQDFDHTQAYTLRFVNQGTGLILKRTLLSGTAPSTTPRTAPGTTP